MTKRFVFLLVVFICLVPITSSAQEIPSDLSEIRFLELVMQNHPVSQQADNMAALGRYAIMSARGGFDPYLYSKSKQKFYQGTNYYLYSNSGVSMPTRTGISFQAGYDWNEGIFVNPEQSLPNNGLWYAGINVPVMQGLLMDERRTALRQAIMDEMQFNNVTRLLLNDVFLDGSKFYWQWVQFYYQKQVIDEALDLAQQNLRNYILSFEQGDIPAIDTLEANIQLQNLLIQQQQLSNDLENAYLMLNNFLWGQDQVPLSGFNVSPTKMTNLPVFYFDTLRFNVDEYLGRHPIMRDLQIKIQKLNIEGRMKQEKLKPKLDLQYNILQRPASDLNVQLGVDNYNWGVNFSFPMFLRTERGDLRMNQIKVDNLSFEMIDLKQDLTNRAKQNENTFDNLSEQLETYRQVVEQLDRLLQAEIRKFEIGESSIFLINFRQMSLVNARMKYIEMQAKNRFFYRVWLHSLGADPQVWLAL